MRDLVLILGDQLSHDFAGLKASSKETDTIVMAEISEEAQYVPHHKQKLALIFSAMRHFASECEEKGWSKTLSHI